MVPPLMEFESMPVAEDPGIHTCYLRHDRTEVIRNAVDARGTPRLQICQHAGGIATVPCQYAITWRRVKAAERTRVDVVARHALQRTINRAKLRHVGGAYQIERSVVGQRRMCKRGGDTAPMLDTEEPFRIVTGGTDSALLPAQDVAAVASCCHVECIPAGSFRQPEAETDTEVTPWRRCPMADLREAAALAHCVVQRKPQRLRGEAHGIKEIALAGTVRANQNRQWTQLYVARRDVLVVAQRDPGDQSAISDAVHALLYSSSRVHQGLVSDLFTSSQLTEIRLERL